jgi:iron-sulfur cluster assembly accessory protein
VVLTYFIVMDAPEQSGTESELTLTDSATAQIKALLARDGRDGQGLRVSVAGGGCSGFSYHLSFDKEPKPEDVVLDRDGIKVYVDRSSVSYLNGTVIDFVGGLYGGGFKFINPNATATCGCGTSFSA